MIIIYNKEIARHIRFLNDKIYKRTWLNYSQFCDAIDREIHNDYRITYEGNPTMPARDWYKAVAEMFDKPGYNFYGYLMDILYGQ